MATPFDYRLPADLIAQHPSDRRDHARLMVVDPATGAISHRRFDDLPSLLRAGDLLVLNDTRVLQARLLGRRAQTGGKWEGLFLAARPDGAWEMLCQTGGRLRSGEIISIPPGPLELTVLEKLAGGTWLLRPNQRDDVERILDRFGHVPLPPYIRKGADERADRERYQTVFAARPGAAAAPTAGLHFTDEVFDRLKALGISWTTITLHVGLGTFQPIQSDDLSQHKMHREWGQLSREATSAIAECKRSGGRVVAVGTTSVRVLETAAHSGALEPWSGETELFIRPPYRFQVVDALVTNFHLPHTTLLFLVAAFAGVELLSRAYAVAVAEQYRFYSYGDAMLVL